MALGNWSNPYGALGGGKPSTGDLTMFGGAPASTSGGGFFSKLGGGDMWGMLGASLIGGFFQNYRTKYGMRLLLIQEEEDKQPLKCLT